MIHGLLYFSGSYSPLFLINSPFLHPPSSQDMFPDVEVAVIRTVLESKNGSVEGAVAAILQITQPGIDEESEA